MSQQLHKNREADEKRWAMLMKSVQSGDQIAYKTLLTELNQVIEAYIRVHFGTSPLIEDFVQECMIAIHKARHTYHPNRLFRPWLFTIVRHKTIDMLRKHAPEKMEMMDEDVDLIGHPEHIDQLERMVDGSRLMNQLPIEQKQAIALTKYLGFTTDEAAKMMGIKESTLKARLRRGLEKLSNAWQQDWHDNELNQKP